MIADPTSAAVLGLIIRIFSNPDLILGGDNLINQLIRLVLQWNDVETSQNIIYAMAGDRNGSYFLETVFECCNIELFVDITKNAIINSNNNKIIDYVHDNSANFVIQSLLKRLTNELNQNYTNELENIGNQLLISLINNNNSENETNELFEELIEKRGGVILWLLELSLILSLKSDNKWFQKLSKLLINYWITKNNITLTVFLENILSKKVIEKKDMIDNKDSNQLLIAKLISVLLKGQSFHTIATSLIDLSEDTLMNICCSGPLSRIIFDILISNINQTLLAALINKLLPVLSILCVHYVGQHVFRQLFYKSDIQLKELIVSTIIHDKSKLMQTKEGRNSLTIMNVELYLKNINEWKQTIMKANKMDNNLHEMNSNNNNLKNNNNNKRKIENNIPNEIIRNNNNNETNNNNNNSEEPKKKKRIRKRPVKKTTEGATADTNAIENDSDDE